jgi:hypothetical protein
MFHQEVGEKVLVRVRLQEVGWLLGFCLDWRVGAGVGVGGGMVVGEVVIGGGGGRGGGRGCVMIAPC